MNGCVVAISFDTGHVLDVQPCHDFAKNVKYIVNWRRALMNTKTGTHKCQSRLQRISTC